MHPNPQFSYFVVFLEGLAIAPLIKHMEGYNIPFDSFYRLLRKCNIRLFVSGNPITMKGLQEYPVIGLYVDLRDKSGTDRGITHIMGIPHSFIPEYSIVQLDNDTLGEDKGKLVYRGWKAILNHLVKTDYINKDKAERTFRDYGFHYEEKRQNYPKNLIYKAI